MPKVSKEVSELMEEGMRNMVLCNPDALNKAIEYFDQALAQEPNNLEALYYKGLSLFLLDDDLSATKQADKILKIKADSILGLNLQARIYGNNNEEERAKELFNKIILIKEEQTKGATYLYVIGNTYSLLKDYDNAITHQLEALKCNENHALSTFALARSYGQKQNYNEAIKLLEKLKDTWQDNSSKLYGELAEYYQKIGDYENAIINYEKEREIVGEEKFEGALELAKCYVEIDNLEQAISYFLVFKDNNEQDLTRLSECAYAMIELAERKEKENSNREKVIAIKKYAQELLELIYETFHSHEYNRKSLSAEQKKYIKSGFAIKGQLKRELDEINNSSIVRKDQVSHAIDHNNEWVEKERNLKYITDNKKLGNYYTAFRHVIDKYLINAFVVADGKVELKRATAFKVGDFIKDSVNFAPGLGAILNVTLKATEFAYETHKENQAKRILDNLKYFQEAQRIAEHVAMEVTLKQEDKILNLSVKQELNTVLSKILAAQKKVKDKFIVDLKDTPEKALAYEDVSIMISLCQKSLIEVEPNSTIEDTFVGFILDTSKRLEDGSLIDKAMNSVSKHTKSCTIMAVTDIIYDNPILNDSEKLLDAYKAGGMNLVNALFTAFQPLDISGEDFYIENS